TISTRDWSSDVCSSDLENSWGEIVAQLVTQNKVIARTKINDGQFSWPLCPKPKRREDVCALRRSGTCRTKHRSALHIFRAQRFWSAMRFRIAFMPSH